MRKVWQKSKIKMAEGIIKSIKSHMQNGAYSTCVHLLHAYICLQGEGLKPMAPKKCCEIFFVHWFGQAH